MVGRSYLFYILLSKRKNLYFAFLELSYSLLFGHSIKQPDCGGSVMGILSLLCIIVILSFSLSNGTLASATTYEPASDWNLIWHDEFDTDKIDNSKWNIVDWAAEKNNELQYYTPSSVTISNGYLRIISQANHYKGRMYTSGAIETQDKFTFLYGKVEIRAKLPRGKGLFPAFWTLPAQRDTYLPEIDIMEMLGDKPQEIWVVYHWVDSQGNKRKLFSSSIGPDYSAAFHTYSMEWFPEQIRWYIDGVPIFLCETAPTQPLFLYMNTAIGGDWPGNPDDTTIFPQFLDIDYIRVYQKKARP
jgi:beta-glucanase (GH16 family)